MKNKNYFLFSISLFAMHQSYCQANTQLSNLTAPTHINVPMLPGADNAYNLGSNGKSWKHIYLDGSLYLNGIKFLTNQGTNTFIGATGNTSNIGIGNIFIGLNTGQSNITGDYNSASGNGAMYSNTIGDYNTAYGFEALYFLTSGSGNTAVGHRALYNTTGSGNTAIGNETLQVNTTGDENTATGDHALYSNTTGYGNVANGSTALSSNTTGSFNTANGYQALYFNQSGDYNTANGSYTLYSNTIGDYNTANGLYALYTNTEGFANTANGAYALWSNTIGNNNTANGADALLSNTTGSHNTATGAMTLWSNTTGSFNTANGFLALHSNITGIENTANGFYALASNTEGSGNTANGYYSLRHNYIGSYNTADGYAALASNYGDHNTANGSYTLGSNTNGNNNTAIGFFALGSNTEGSGNTGLGYAADIYPPNATIENATVIGAFATIDASNKVRIGNSSVLSNGGEVNWTAYSDSRIKDDVQENVPGIEFINELRPVTYHFNVAKQNQLEGISDTMQWEGKYDIEEIQWTGFLAQEVDAAAQKIDYDFSGIDKSGKLMGLRYAEFVVPLVKATQELDAVNNGQDELNASQQTEIDELKIQIAALTATINSTGLNDGAAIISINETGNAMLGQNIPNPYDNTTLIPFRIPKGCKDASIMITDIAFGKVITVIPISCTETHISFEAGELASGTYSYSLIVDGVVIGTKKMVLTK